jgi:hypothetical protein
MNDLRERIDAPPATIVRGTTGRADAACLGRRAAIETTGETPVTGATLGTADAVRPGKSDARCARSAGSGRSRSASKR